MFSHLSVPKVSFSFSILPYRFSSQSCRKAYKIKKLLTKNIDCCQMSVLLVLLKYGQYLVIIEL